MSIYELCSSVWVAFYYFFMLLRAMCFRWFHLPASLIHALVASFFLLLRAWGPG